MTNATLQNLQGWFPNLRTLWLHDCILEVVNAELLPFSLHTLDIYKPEYDYPYDSDFPLDWFEPFEMGHLKSLKVLKLSHCSRISTIDIEHICNVTTIEVLDLSYCTRVTDKALNVVAEKLTGLTELRINGTSCTNHALYRISKNLINLKLLDINDISRLTDFAVGAVAGRLHNLVHLDIGRCENLTDAAVNSVADNLKQLEVFRFCYTKTTCRPVKSFFKKMPKLRDIEMDEIDDEGLRSLLQFDLVSLKVGVTNVSGKLLIQLQNLKNLTNLTLCYPTLERSIKIPKGRKIPYSFILPHRR